MTATILLLSVRQRRPQLWLQNVLNSSPLLNIPNAAQSITKVTVMAMDMQQLTLPNKQVHLLPSSGIITPKMLILKLNFSWLLDHNNYHYMVAISKLGNYNGLKGTEETTMTIAAISNAADLDIHIFTYSCAYDCIVNLTSLVLYNHWAAKNLCQRLVRAAGKFIHWLTISNFQPAMRKYLIMPGTRFCTTTTNPTSWGTTVTTRKLNSLKPTRDLHSSVKGLEQGWLEVQVARICRCLTACRSP